MAPKFGISFLVSINYFLFMNLWIYLSCINISGVHDSYWTHACDVDRMNRILREKFVDLYERPILESVRTFLSLLSWCILVPGPTLLVSLWYHYLKCLIEPLNPNWASIVLVWTSGHICFILFQKAQLQLYQVDAKMNIYFLDFCF